MASNRPAVIFLAKRKSDFHVAGLSVLDRLLVAIHRAGAGPITIAGSESLPALRRSQALGIETRQIEEPPVSAGPTLVASSDVLVTRSDIEALIARGGRLTTPCGTPLPIGIAARSTGSLSLSLLEGPDVAASGVARVVRDAADARAAEHALWRSFRSAGDGLVDRFFNRPLARIVSRRLVSTDAAPNQITVLAVLVGLLAAFFVAQGTYSGFVTGAALFQLVAIIDCVDGDIARALFKESRAGKWFDLLGDQVVHIALFSGLAFGVGRSESSAPALVLGISAVLGVVLSALALLVWAPRIARRHDDRAEAWTRFFANRDFSVLLLLFALFDKVDVFLWATATCIHVVWTSVLLGGYAQRRWRRTARKDARNEDSPRTVPRATKGRMP